MRFSKLGFPLPRTIAVVDLKQISKNLTRLSQIANENYEVFRGAVPMLKSNAYGHGMTAVARTLGKHKNTTAFGVATIYEGIVLRQSGVRVPIWVFSDGSPWNEDSTQACHKFDLTPVFHDLQDLEKSLSRFKGRFHLKFNTGMNRLGIAMEDVSASFRLLKKKNIFSRLDGICTHLASSDNSKSVLTRIQISRFKDIVGALPQPTNHIHCSNTDGIYNSKMHSFCTTIRPGLGVYGYSSKNDRSIQPALRWYALVLQSRKIKPKEAVGYGETFHAKKSQNIAVLGVGYGDGIHRTLSNKEILISDGKKLQRSMVAGRVSMDLLTLVLQAKSGDWILLFGHNRQQGLQNAKQAGTIIYEILTGIGARVPRVYK
ncbi:MAG: alanine racemase [Bacteriovoracia bacterium]